ncbi:hypothetical protein MMC13_001781 [Lambiella insularis]|nr:hypothetical protein [Lambiella insularis]
MDKMHQNNSILLPLRGVAVLFTIIELGLTAYCVSVYDGTFVDTDGFVFTLSWHSMNFLLFCSLWSLLLLAYLLLILKFNKFSHHLISFVLLLLTSLFWFAGFIAVAVGTSGLCYGVNASNGCNTAKAAAAFGAFLWLIFLVDAVFAGLGSFRGGRSSGNNFGQGPMQTA